MATDGCTAEASSRYSRTDLVAGSWPQDRGDPFDRMLAAQSDKERIPVATNDPKIELFGVETIW